MSETCSVYTVFDYLKGKVKFGIPKSALMAIMADRNIEPDTAYANRDVDAVRLAYADMLKWFVVGPSKRNNVSDTDNGWTHTGGGYELDDTDRKLLIKEANAIYDELEPDSEIKNKSTFRMMSFGIQHANYDAAGNPLPHVIR